MFYVGQRVECIDAKFTEKNRYWVKRFPVEGGIYTVRETVHGYRGLGLRLVEIENPKIPVVGIVGMIEPLFLASRFRIADSVAKHRDVAVCLEGATS